MSSAAAIQSIIASAPPGANLFLLVRDAIISAVFPGASQDFFIQLYCLAAADGIIMLLLLLAMVVHWVKGTFWIFRTQTNSRGTYIIPHPVLGWTFPAAFFFAACVFYIIKTIRHLRGIPVYNLAATQLLIWTPGFIAAWIASWNLAVGYILKLRNADSFFLSAPFVNGFAIGLPLANFAMVLPFGVLAQARYNIAEEAYNSLINDLTSLAKTFNPATFTVLNLLPVFGLTQHLIALTADLDNMVSTASGTLAFWSLFMMIIGITFSVLQLRSLSKSIKAASVKTTSRLNGTSDQLSNIKKMFYLTILTVTTFSISQALFAGCCIYIAAFPLTSLTTSSGVRAETLTTLYAFCLPGAPTAIAVFWRSFYVPPKETPFNIAVATQVISYTTWPAPDEIRFKEHSRTVFIGSFDDQGASEKEKNLNDSSSDHMELTDIGMRPASVIMDR